MKQTSNQSSSQSQSESNINFQNLVPSLPTPSHIITKTHLKHSKTQQQQPSYPQHLPSITLLTTNNTNLIIPHQNKSRLIIHQIILTNFKSYADTQIIGPFHTNFTSVVGPNGSGKSNLIQSMLFIFGYKANWMRLKSLNQLIHNSSTMTKIQKASVQVHFKKIIQSQNSKIIQIPNQQFTLKRTVKQSGQSKYYINNTQSTQAQVKSKLKQQGIDLNNNRFLILQGQVQQISQMKQKSGDHDKPGLLQYLQDIIGSNTYIDQIQQNVNKYNTIQQTKHQKGQLMKLAQIQLKSMNKSKQQAVRYVKKQRQIYQIHNILHQVIISNSKSQSKQHTQKLHKLQQQRDQIINQQKQKLRKQAQRIQKIKKLRTQLQHIQTQLTKQKDLMNRMNIIDKNLRQQLNYKGQDLGKYKIKFNDLDNELTLIIKQSDQIKSILPSKKQKLNNIKNNVDQLQNQLTNYDQYQFKQEFNNLEISFKKVQFDIKNFQSKSQSLQTAYHNFLKNNENLSTKNIQLQKKIYQDTQTLSRITQAQLQATTIKTSLQTSLHTLSQTRRQTQSQLQKITHNLRQQQHTTKQTGLYNDMFQKIMQQNIPGVLGRLGDLGSVPKQYDQIITTCCSRLDNLVVKNTQSAQIVLKFLKNSKLGRVTCIILDKLDQFKRFMDKPWNQLPNTIRLFDVIKPTNEQVKIAFYFAISDTIFCQNNQLGIQYAMKDDKNRRRVISRKQGGGYILYQLNGLINGCLPKSGGFTVRAKHKVRSNQPKQQRQLQKQKLQLSQSLLKLQQKSKNIHNQLLTVVKDLNQFKNEKIKIQLSISQSKQQLNDLNKNLFNNNKNLSSDKIAKEKQISALKKYLEQLYHSKKQITNKINAIEKQQKSKQTQKVTRLRNTYKLSKQQYQQLDKDIQKKLAILETTIKRVSQNKKSKQQLTKRIALLTSQITKIQKQIYDLQQTATHTFAKMKAHDQKIQKYKKQQQQLKILFNQQDKQVKQSKLKIQNAKQQVELCKNKIKSYFDTIAFAEQQLRKSRQTYRQLSDTYDFLQQLDSIEFMNIQSLKKSIDPDQSSFLNQSFQLSNPSQKTFPLQKLLQSSPSHQFSQQQLSPFLNFIQKMRTMLITQNQNLKKISGNNLQIITQFKKKYLQYKNKYQQFESIQLSQLQLKKYIQSLKFQRLQLFRSGFNVINSKLKQVYQLLTKGGDAELELIDSLDPFSDGINFSVRPPKKAWKQINKLSGGEKTLSSLSLIFALHYYKPTPLYFMDQIDAALDFKNVSIVADYIKKRTQDAQFIIISLRNNMFELANKLIGVYKTYDKTKIVHFIPNRLIKSTNIHAQFQKQNLDNNHH